MDRAVFSLSIKNALLHSLFLILAVLAAYFYKERLVADSSYYLFRVINNGTFWVEHNRYILIFSQVLPLLGVLAGLSLKAVLVLYSIGHVLFFYLIFLVAHYKLSFKQAGVLLLLTQTLGLLSGFFVPMFELYYCAGLLVLLMALMRNLHKRNYYLLIAILSFFILTSHFYGYLLLLFVIAMHFEKHRWQHKRHYWLVVTMMAAVSVFKKYNVTDYEAGKITAFLNTLEQGVYNFQYLKSLSVFLFKYYKELILLQVITLIYLLVTKQLIRALLVMLAFLGALALANISNYGFEHSRYQEQVYFPLSFIVALSFTQYFFSQRGLKWGRHIFVLVLLIVVLRIGGIIQESDFYAARVAELEQKIERAKESAGSKFVVKEASLRYDANWSYPIESMLLSARPAPEQTITICTDTDYYFNQNNHKLLKSEYLFRRWETYPVKSLNERYFILDSLGYAFLK